MYVKCMIELKGFSNYILDEFLNNLDHFGLTGDLGLLQIKSVANIKFKS